MPLNAAQVEANLPHTEQAPGVARRVLAQGLPALTGEELDRAKLLVSELVTNAVVHGRGEIVLRARLDDDRLLVEVIDEGCGFVPTVQELDPGGVGGRGLAVVDAAASRWGIHEGSTRVWFELERPGPDWCKQ
jgi:anti-sigma regulatory factor (Ser/Thr protein kinase)